ncbi:unnamed protein product [Cylicocyclus nassatus]|uniref:Uncharacterized protein n=1 Tax=Cylicocyclus nassatus TaxID=53992 RepID=A0AA36GN82_CYLNA|nr:unnamed protein product [Cylicocyclus nassatus]
MFLHKEGCRYETVKSTIRRSRGGWWWSRFWRFRLDCYVHLFSICGAKCHWNCVALKAFYVTANAGHSAQLSVF